MEERPKFNGRRPIRHSGKKGKPLVMSYPKGIKECTLCGERWSVNGNNHNPRCPRGCTKKDLHTKEYTPENSSQEELDGLVQKEPRFRPICWGGLNLDMEDLAWKFEIKRV